MTLLDFFHFQPLWSGIICWWDLLEVFIDCVIFSQVRVVSLPCWELFEAQDEDYKSSVLPAEVTARVAVEAGCSMGWSKYTGLNGEFVGHDDFGASAPGPNLHLHTALSTHWFELLVYLFVFPTVGNIDGAAGWLMRWRYQVLKIWSGKTTFCYKS